MIHLDSDVIVDFLRGDPRVAERFAERAASLAIATPVVAELYYGANAAQHPAQRVAEIRQLIDQVAVVPFDLAAAEAYGRIRSELRTAGTPIGEMDTLIAAVAIANQAILATRNVKHFKRVAGLTLENWPHQGGLR